MSDCSSLASHTYVLTTVDDTAAGEGRVASSGVLLLLLLLLPSATPPLFELLRTSAALLDPLRAEVTLIGADAAAAADADGAADDADARRAWLPPLS